MKLDATDAVAAMNELVALGFTHDFRFREGALYDLRSDQPLDPAAVNLVAVFRFEADPGADDASNVFALSVDGGQRKGFLVDAFDLRGESASAALAGLLGATPDHTRSHGSGASELRYGLRKVRKADFDADPERYVLRLDFPDFPPCPFGQGFAMLGFDTAQQEYVWLATRILRDERLRRIPYSEPGTDA